MRIGSTRVRLRLAAVGFIAGLALASCGSPLSLLQLLDGPTGEPLTVSPNKGIITVSSSVTLTVEGGYPPYRYSVISGIGTLSDNVYAAPAVASQETIRVSDRAGNTVDSVFQMSTSGGGLPPLTADIRYSVTSYPTGGIETPATALSETFTITNSGTVAGTQDVSWSAFLSPDTVFDSGTDIPIGSGTLAGGLAAGATSGPLALNGTWPLGTDPWPYYIIIRISANEDSDKSDNQVITAPFQRSVSGGYDYTVAEISLNYPSETANTAIRDIFTLVNVGDAAGSAYDWNLYRSTDSVIGGDTLIASSVGNPGLGPASATTISPVPAQWPEVAAPTQFWLVVEIVPSTADESPGNDAAIQGPYTVNPAPDYRIDSVTVQYAAGEVAQPLDTTGPFNFRIANDGATGSAPVRWDVYVSDDELLDASDSLLTSGFLTGLGAGATTAAIDIGAESWPAEGRIYYLFFVVDAADDTNSVNNVSRSGAIPVPYRYVEGIENNDDTGPTVTPLTNVSNLGPSLGTGGTLDPGELIRIEGAGDGALGSDTYGMILGAGTTTVSTWAIWGVTADGIDLFFWDESNYGWDSVSTAPFREPAAGTYTETGRAAGERVYVSANFFADLTTDYVLYILGE